MHARHVAVPVPYQLPHSFPFQANTYPSWIFASNANLEEVPPAYLIFPAYLSKYRPSSGVLKRLPAPPCLRGGAALLLRVFEVCFPTGTMLSTNFIFSALAVACLASLTSAGVSMAPTSERPPVPTPVSATLDPCFLVPDPGPCYGAFPRYFYDQDAKVRRKRLCSRGRGTIPYRFNR